jgi:hypothetical protein
VNGGTQVVYQGNCPVDGRMAQMVNSKLLTRQVNDQYPATGIAGTYLQFHGDVYNGFPPTVEVVCYNPDATHFMIPQISLMTDTGGQIWAIFPVEESF